jgi:hypothetical protein
MERKLVTDEFGGSRRLSFQASGFFRLAKHAGRWWFVTPEGSAFLSFGINHVEPRIMRAVYNLQHWCRQFGLALFEDEESFLPHFQNKAAADITAFGFNTLGCHNSPENFPRGFLPYVKAIDFVDIHHWKEPGKEAFHDVFASAFEDHCDRLARADAAPLAEDRYLLGYSLTDCPIFTDLDAAPRVNTVYGGRRRGLPTWPGVLRNLGPDAPGKKTYVGLMSDRYQGDIERFNEVYATSFGGFQELAKRSDWRPATDLQNTREVEDNLAFLCAIVGRYYTTAVQAIRRHDPNHLIFGDKLNGNTDTPIEIVRLADRHMDLIFYQYYALWPDQKTLLDRWSTVTAKPFFAGDASCSVTSRRIPDPFGPHLSSQEERAERALEIFEHAFARPDFVGWSWCGWMDQWQWIQPAKQHSGLQTPFGELYRPMQLTFADFSSRLYDVAGIDREATRG